MSTYGERIKALRESMEGTSGRKKMSQTEFAEQLGVSRGVIVNLEKGNTEAKEQFTKLICSKFNVNADWIENGRGEMKIDLSVEEKISDFVGKALAEEGTFKKQFIQILANLDEEGWKKLDEAAKALLDAQEQSKGGGE